MPALYTPNSSGWKQFTYLFTYPNQLMPPKDLRKLAFLSFPVTIDHSHYSEI